MSALSKTQKKLAAFCLVFWAGLGLASFLETGTGLAVSSTSPLDLTPRILTDSRGHQLAMPGPPRRIASGNVAADEILLELTQRAKVRERLVAVSALADDARYANASAEAKTVPGRVGLELESLLRHRPDLVILDSYNRPEMITRLEQAGIRTFVMGGHTSLTDVAAHISTLGRLTYLDEAAKDLREDFDRRRTQWEKEAAAAKVQPSVLSFAESGVIAGQGTIFHDVVTSAGFYNLAARRKLKGWSRVSTETLVSMAPDYVIASGDESERPTVLKKLATLPGWQSLQAVKEGRVLLVPERELSAASHHVLKAIERLRKAAAHLPKPGSASQKSEAMESRVPRAARPSVDAP